MNLKKISSYLIYFFVAYILVNVLVYALQEEFIFLEKELHKDFEFNFEVKGDSERDLVFEELFFTHENGDQINALYFKTNDSLKGNILYFHGNAGNLSRWGNYASQFTRYGYNILMIDYRGYGKSDGKPSETHLFEDGQKAYDWLNKNAPSENLIIYGRSLGSGVACHVAATNTAKMLILESPFNEIKDVVQTRFPFLFLKFPFRHKFQNNRTIQKVNYPIHIFHGTKDSVVPFQCAEKLQKYLKPDDQFYPIENAGHNNLSEFPGFSETLGTLLENQH